MKKHLPEARYLVFLLIIVSISGHLAADIVDGLHADMYHQCLECTSHRDASPSLAIFRDAIQPPVVVSLGALFVFAFVFRIPHLRSTALTLLVPLRPPQLLFWLR